jgi:uncharacterized protein
MTDPPTDHAGMEVLGHSECLRLLFSHQVGRIGFIDAGEPQILPVHYRLHDGRVVFRSAVGAKLDAAMRKDPVAFEIDGVDDESASGWSVVVHGTASEVHKDDEKSALESLGIESWLQGPQPMRWIQIRPTEITGRRLPVRG